MIEDNIVSWVVFVALGLLAIGLFFLKCYQAQNKPVEKKIKYDQDLIFFD